MRSPGGEDHISLNPVEDEEELVNICMEGKGGRKWQRNGQNLEEEESKGKRETEKGR